MSYIAHGIEALSKSQIGKLLKGGSVRVKHGRHHTIHLSEEHGKKLHRAYAKGKGITIKLDPYAIDHNQHLRDAVKHLIGRGTGTKLGGVLGGVAGTAAEDAGARLTRALEGSGARRRMHGRGTGTKLGGVLGGVAGTAAEDAGARLTRALEGSGVNRINKFNRWTGALGNAYQGVAHAVKPVAQPIFGAMTDRAVDYINPSQQQQLMDSMMGMGVKKSRGRPRKIHGDVVHGGAVNRINKFNRWTGALGNAYQGVAHAVKPVAQPIFGAMTDRAVDYINPSPQQQLMDSMMGLGVKKNRGRPRNIYGGAAVPAGY